MIFMMDGVNKSMRDWFRIFAILAMVSISEFLIFSSKFGSTSFILFFVSLSIIVIICNDVHYSWRVIFSALAVMVLSLLPIIYDVGIWQILIGFWGVAYLTKSVTSFPENPGSRGVMFLPGFLVFGWRRFFKDFCDFLDSIMGKLSHYRVNTATWFVSIAMSLVFIILLSMANPLIAYFIVRVIKVMISGDIDVSRAIFWIFTLIMIWPFLHVREGSALPMVNEAVSSSTKSDIMISDNFLNGKAIIHSLAVFNAIFLMETILDAMYLWSGMPLPDGMSYATYAHRGAYTLVAVAILAGGFILLTMRSRRCGTESRAERNLVYALLVQNVFLIISSMARLNSYVENYSLANERINAFIFMILVMVATILIIVATMHQKNISWFFKTSFCAVFASIYVSSLIDFSRIVVTYNIEHCREVSGRGPPLDLSYIIYLGLDAVPVMDSYQKKIPDIYTQYEKRVRNEYKWPYDGSTINWRQWNIHNWRLSSYFNRTTPHHISKIN